MLPIIQKFQSVWINARVKVNLVASRYRWYRPCEMHVLARNQHGSWIHNLLEIGFKQAIKSTNHSFATSLGWALPDFFEHHNSRVQRVTSLSLRRQMRKQLKIPHLLIWPNSASLQSLEKPPQMLCCSERCSKLRQQRVASDQGCSGEEGHVFCQGTEDKSQTCLSAQLQWKNLNIYRKLPGLPTLPALSRQLQLAAETATEISWLQWMSGQALSEQV